MKRKRIILWILGAAITIFAAFYQKITGPTYPKNETVTVNDKDYDIKLIRTYKTGTDAPVNIAISDETISLKLFYKNYPEIESDEYKEIAFEKATFKEGFLFWKKEITGLQAFLPHQPEAGKLMYYIGIYDDNNTKKTLLEEPVLIRFKGDVPAYVILPHILFIFFAMFLANVSGLFAAFKVPQFRRYTNITLVLMLLGGMILGPIVQKFAFSEFWTGVPFGWDLTDNKTLIAFIAWIIAFILNRKKENRTSVIVASIVTIIIFSIPHSMFGSELNRETGDVVQGFIQLYF